MTRVDDRGIERLRRVLDAPDLDDRRYRVIEPLGQGGMGTVYLAEDRLLERPVALKVLHVEDLSEEGIERMSREARTLARLEHPGIVPIHDLGRLPDGRVYYVMKRVNGARLDHHVTAQTALAERLRLFLKMCEAVAFAHAAGVLHRDLKPANVMVGEFGEVLILDWGIARWTHGGREHEPPGALSAAAPGRLERRPEPVSASAAGHVTRPGTILGTPDYMAPEQARGEAESVDARTDVYGLGATLWFLLTGAPPGQGPAPRPAALASVCARALAEDPGHRYPTAAELAADVERFLDGARVLAHRESPLERAGRFARRHRVAIGLVVAYLAARVLLWAFARR